MEIQEKEVFKVEALHRFLFAPTGRIYDPGNVFEVKTKTDFDYLTVGNKLCKPAKKDAEITETEQDKMEKAAQEQVKAAEANKKEVLSIIEEKVTEKPKKGKTKK